MKDIKKSGRPVTTGETMVRATDSGGGDDDDGTAKAPKVGLRKDGAVLSH